MSDGYWAEKADMAAVPADRQSTCGAVTVDVAGADIGHWLRGPVAEELPVTLFAP